MQVHKPNALNNNSDTVLCDNSSNFTLSLQGNGPKQHTDLSTERNGMQETPISKRRPKGISTTNTLGLYYLTKGKLVV